MNLAEGNKILSDLVLITQLKIVVISDIRPLAASVFRDNRSSHIIGSCIDSCLPIEWIARGVAADV